MDIKALCMYRKYITLLFGINVEIILFPAHYFLIVRDAQESLVWKLRAVFTIDSEATTN